MELEDKPTRLLLYNLTMAEEWLTVAQAVELSGYHPDHIRRLTRSGELHARKFGPVWQVNRQALLDYIEAAKGSGDRRKGPKP